MADLHLTQKQQRLVEENIHLVPFMLKKMHVTYNYDDLFGEGCIGLCKAAALWKENGLAFTTFACHMIRHEVVNHIKYLKNPLRNAKVYYLEDVLKNLTTEETGFEQAEDREFLSEISKAADLILDEEERKIINCLIRGMSIAEICALTGEAVGEVASIRKQAARKLNAWSEEGRTK